MSTDPQYQPLPRAKRPLWRIIVGVVLLVVAAFMALGVLMNVANGTYASAQNGGELVGMLLASVCCLGLPLLGGILLVALPGRRG